MNDGLRRCKELWVICSSEGYTWCILRILVKEGRIRRSHSECPTCFSETRQPRWRMHPSNETSGARRLLNETQPLLLLYAPPFWNASIFTKLIILRSKACSDPVRCDWPNTSSVWRKCYAPYHICKHTASPWQQYYSKNKRFSLEWILSLDFNSRWRSTQMLIKKSACAFGWVCNFTLAQNAFMTRD